LIKLYQTINTFREKKTQSSSQLTVVDKQSRANEAISSAIKQAQE